MITVKILGFLFRFFLLWTIASIVIVIGTCALIATNWPRRRPRE